MKIPSWRTWLLGKFHEIASRVPLPAPAEQTQSAEAYDLVRFMTHKIFVALIASLGIGLAVTPNGSFARSGAPHGMSSASRSASHPSAVRSRHDNARTLGWGWPAAAGFSYAPSNGEPKADVTQPISGDIHYTYTYEPPWDAAHRYWPGISESKPVVRVSKPYVPGCPTQAVTVPLGDGRDQTVNIVRCF
jgi:hypothetical protein